MAKFYITTPIYYANAEPHIGHAYTTIAADLIARWHRLHGDDVFFLTGTDEHGQKIQEMAEKAGLKPKDFVDNIAKKFKDAFKLFNISNDNFIRTTDLEHESDVKRILQELYDKKFIYKGIYEADYCVGCEQYINKSDLVNGCCQLHKRKPEIIKEESYMFKLSAFQNTLLKLIEEEKLKILPKKKRKEMISFISGGLQDISFSRKKSKVSWGIELPFDKDHTSYVWVDAFWNYVTGLKEKKVFDKYWPADLQLMANDIFRVHSTIWPAILLALNMELPKVMFIHGYFTVNGQKMSKSLGNAINPIELAKKYSVDGIRYFLIREIPFGEDGDFSEDALRARLNNELLGDLGNLVSRVLTLAEKNFSIIKKSELDEKLASKFDLKKIEEFMEKFELHNALSEIWKFIGEVNRHITQEKPWELKGKDLEKHLYTLLESIRIISILVSPFIPETSEKTNQQLGIENGKIKDCKFGLVKEYNNFKKGQLLFQKV